LLFSDWRQVPTATDAFQCGGFVWRGLVPWNKGRGARAPHKGYFRHQCEYVIWGTRGACPQPTHAGPFDGCPNFPVLQSDKFHLCGKPTPLYAELLSIVPRGSTVLDPFMGSGTAGEACAMLGHHFIGIEQDRQIFRDAADRIARARQRGGRRHAVAA
jgi:site-specific DNA-methyltransferase (adenine-specific)